ncbi:probable lipase/esterase [Lentisphaera araneosa HTCC2155]|uniref:Probable lipase/esterase n=1 Tax=Lentisphaera araneosa HTCC2155 TaxID=313628 RepID=A6DLB1_9BACT|nr:alpha/beta hydrolase [Lentisphaera araneosa]EDM27713.1 probable lipase/esterase [Lentisphaera araneosa HTCC2155]
MKYFLIAILSISLFAQKDLKDITFAITVEKKLEMDIYFPKGKQENRPMLMWIHGGGWKGGSKKDCKLQWLTEYGYVVASVSYRFSQEAKFPAQIHDCKAALRFLKANAVKYGLDKKRFAVGGSSAGGQLAALMATSSGDDFLDGELGDYSEENTQVSAVIDFYGASDFLLREKNQPEKVNKKGGVVYELLGGNIQDKKDLAKKASAAYQVDHKDSPILIIHGSKDRVVLPGQSKRLHEVYQSKGLNSQLHILEGASHGGKAFGDEEVKKNILKFLKANGV